MVLRGVGVVAGGPLEVGGGRVLVTASKQEPPSMPSTKLSLHFCKLPGICQADNVQSPQGTTLSRERT